MKKMFFCIAMLAIACVAMGQAKPTKVAEKKSNTKIEKVDNKTFRATKVDRAKDTNSYKPTDNYYIARDGKKYQIYLHTCKKGKHKGETFCYILRTSAKTGKTYWQKLELGVGESLIITETINVKPEELSK